VGQRAQRVTLGNAPVITGGQPEAETHPAAAKNEDFNWSDNDSVMLREQRATAIYFNTHGDLVIRQERHCPFEDEDPFIVINAENIAGFLDKLTNICGVPSFPPGPPGT
jgi:hypothetical protein